MINELNIEKEITFGTKEEGITYFVREGAYGVVFNDAMQVAVLRNSFGHFLPGGGIEEGENSMECLVREFMEETGYEISVKKFIGKASKYYFSEAFNHYRHPIGYFYQVSLEQRVTDLIEEDHELLWLEPLECSKLLYDHQQWAVDEALNMIETAKRDYAK
jgi:8-oxo-dGTP diphosphatase